MILSTVLFYAFIAVVGIQVGYYSSFLFSFSIKRAELHNSNQFPASVIICAKNEAENLKKNLPLIIDQEYPNFEIVLVNDGSSDNTLKIMKAFAEKHSHIKLVNVIPTEAFWGNKKYALTLGIKASTHNVLVFTDADCVPNSNQWLSQIVINFSKSKTIVLGYGAYAKKKLSFLNKLIRFETVMTALQYFSYAKMGMPYMGVGRNMAYRKELFFNNSGFNSHMTLKSGDDDLFINEVATPSNTALCFTKESFTISEPKTTFKDWILQKRRHISTAKFYKQKHKFLLALFYFTNLSFWILGTLLLITQIYWPWVAILIGIRFIIQWLCFGLTARKFEETDLIIFAPFLELFLISAQLSIFIANLISKPKHWK
ncbi:cellulose synthase/poly-beta-1,6-N-acetylglucosamine synthase-like glycosyltransferase [Winogradskyella epiphytica]|uniref:Cellulose synthase/poly-beta-1,6-N-acetylglucosamine synthase-like glycosyltransferase n=1 Tax=Winogradskyella epiphytica TaxID=262005 RepID=A0A2V4XH91_9FLAO|nr:glycosyltransferase [Winogradskyella epiphytica]PYE82620.1 cellulose synthase/poly-beta-1,6-N-acetylglucosamine synthase-like glycosyltransferase [Winogradskyella epiphytica]GGW72295.1 glycosyl transferase family 2 [Winogradskyella epiphytica]